MPVGLKILSPSDATLANRYGRSNGQAGIVTPNFPGATFAQTILVDSRGYVMRFVPDKKRTIVSINFTVTNFATNNDTCDVGIYDAALTRLVSSGPTAGKLNATNGNKSIAITATTLLPGVVYYAALSCGTVGGTAATIIMSTFSSANMAAIYGAAAPQVEGGANGAAATLPASFTLNTTVGAFPTLVLRET